MYILVVAMMSSLNTPRPHAAVYGKGQSRGMGREKAVRGGVCNCLLGHRSNTF